MKPDKKINIDFLHQSVYVYIGNHDKFSKLCAELSFEPPSGALGSAYGCPVKYDSTNVWFVWLKVKSKKSLLHEVVHIVDFIFEWFGFDDKELRAMLVTYIYDNLL